MSGALVILSIFTAIHLLRYWGEKGKLHRYYTSACPPPEVLPKEIILQGEHFELSDDDLDRILKRRFIYYSFLEENLKQRFLKRLKVFMSRKTFIIKDDEGVKEMPVLVSAAAIGLTFGLKDFLLPFYKYIRIYPEEYIAHDSPRLSSKQKASKNRQFITG